MDSGNYFKSEQSDLAAQSRWEAEGGKLDDCIDVQEFIAHGPGIQGTTGKRGIDIVQPQTSGSRCTC
jgi:hypothetical protein